MAENNDIPAGDPPASLSDVCSAPRPARDEAPWRLEVPADAVAENLGAFYVWFDDEAVVVEPTMPELVGAK